MLRELVAPPVRAARLLLARIVAATVDRFPSLEPWFIRTGRTLARRSRFGGGLYWFTQDALMKRWRQRRHRHRTVEIGPVTLIVDVTDATGRHPYFYAQPYEKAVTDAIITALKPGDAFVDIGANVGYFSTLAAKRVGASGRVIAFEPHEGARADLRANVDRNEVAQTVEIVPMAVAERKADFPFYTADRFPSYSTLEPGLSPKRDVAVFRPATVVHATSLDRWLAGRPDVAARVRCIRIDVQGGESRVIAGMARTLHSSGLTVLCETTTGSDADVILQRAGYRRHRIERGTSSYGNYLYVRPGPPPC